MASNGLPSGAFVTTLEGRRCTAVPRVAVASVASDGSSSVATTATSASSTATSPTNNGIAAAPATGIETEAEGQGSASTTASPPVATTTFQDSTGSSQTQGSGEPGSAASQSLDANVQRLSIFAGGAPSESSGAQLPSSSQADTSIESQGTENAPLDPSDRVPTTTTAPNLLVGPAATPLSSTISTSTTPANDPLATDNVNTASSDAAATAVPNLNSNAVQSTVAIAGGVIGGVVALSVLGFFVWWWRRRVRRKRRSTLLTPLDIVPTRDLEEKNGYVISRGSIGPTPVAVKVKAALGQNLKKIQGHIRNRTAPSVNLDRGNSQFIDPSATHSRNNSGVIGVEPAPKPWWARLEYKFRRNNSGSQAKSANAIQEKPPNLQQPDFLTLLSMDNGELDREAQRRRASISRLNGRASSADNFLGSLNLSFGGGDNPFSDANAIAHTSATPAPLAIPQTTPANPFSDTNAIGRTGQQQPPKPATYVADIRRSRSNSKHHNNTGYANHTTRESTGSLRSITTATTTNQRNKFRSDPFDLERPELLLRQPLSRNPSTKNNNNNNPRPPVRAHTRAESFTSRISKYSKYSSGISAMSDDDSVGGVVGSGSTVSMDWSDPGPDVGPGSGSGSASGGRWDGASSNGGGGRGGNGEDSGRQQGREVGNGGKRASGGSTGSVGKAI